MTPLALAVLASLPPAPAQIAPPDPRALVLMIGWTRETVAHYSDAATCAAVRDRIDGTTRAYTIDGVTFTLVARAFCERIAR